MHHIAIATNVLNAGNWIDDSSLGAVLRKSESVGSIISAISATQAEVIAMLRSTNDNLGRHQFLGAKVSTSMMTHRMCTCCNCTSALRHKPISWIDSWLRPASHGELLLTSSASHLRDIEIVQEFPSLSKWLGVSGIMHAYIGVPNFDYIACHSQDVMHNEYVAGGHASKEASRMCSDMFKSVQGSVHHHQLTHKQFNILLADYNYYSARERLNRPSKQKLRAFESDGHLLWTAAEMKVFVFHSERIIGGWVDKTDPAWACWLKHVKYLKLLDLDEIPDEDVNHIQGCISDHHDMFAALYPDLVSPKYHYTGSHTAPDIRVNGPPRETAAWYTEQRHQYYKAVAKHNFNNAPINSNLRKLAIRSHRHSALSAHQSRSRPPKLEAGPLGYPTTMVTIDPSDPNLSRVGVMLMGTDTIQAMLLGSVEDELGEVKFACSYFTSMSFKGHSIAAGDYFVHGAGPRVALSVASQFLEVRGHMFILHFSFQAEIRAEALAQTIDLASFDNMTSALHDVESSTVRFVHLDGNKIVYEV